MDEGCYSTPSSCTSNGLNFLMNFHGLSSQKKKKKKNNNNKVLNVRKNHELTHNILTKYNDYHGDR